MILTTLILAPLAPLQSLFWGKAVCDAAFWGKSDGDGQMLSPAQSAASGFAAACIGPLANNPFDVVKTRMQTSPLQHRAGHRVG